MALTGPVTPGTRITSAWGNTIRDRTVQRFATKSELDLTWSSAGNGAMAVTLDDYRIWVRRGGLWLPPLTLPLGMYYRAADITSKDNVAPTPPGDEERNGIFDQYQLLAGRLYQVLFSCRYEMKVLAAGTFHNFGAVINVTGTGADGPLIYHGSNATFAAGGQEACVFGWPMKVVGDAYRAGTSGLFITAGTPGDELEVRWQHVFVGFGDTITMSDLRLSVMDMGPAI